MRFPGRNSSATDHSLLWVLFLLFGARLAIASQNPEDALAHFENRIRPLLIKECYDCHSATAKKVKGGLRLDSREEILKGGNSGPAIVPGDPERSLLIKAVRHVDKDLAMPRGPEGVRKLPESAITDLVHWVAMGAPYTQMKPASQEGAKRHWSFQPIQNPPTPPVRNSSWCQTSIDHFILAKLEANGAEPAARVNKRALIRRATFDLIGLPPTPEEVDAFLADSSPQAFGKVVDRLLNSPHYGEQWGRHWLDVARYADTAGDTADYPVPTAWRYRNYVIDAFNSDKPYDEFIREQVAGDLLAKEGPREKYAERVTATGFLAVSRRFGYDSENYHHLTIQDTIDTLGQSVLGLSLGCARCHNHKYDPVSSSEYYALYGIFESTRYAFPGSEQKPKIRSMAALLPSEEWLPKWRGFEERFAALGIDPPAVLRPLGDFDGDFEIQKPASGGSKGVLVPPWRYEGAVSVTSQAQSPFKNLHAYGNTGVNVTAGTNSYRIDQMLHTLRGHGPLYLNLDFRAATNSQSAEALHHFSIGALGALPALEVLISSKAIFISRGSDLEKIPLANPGEWQNLQIILDQDTRTFSGTIGVPRRLVSFGPRLLGKSGVAPISFVSIHGTGSGSEALPDLEFDNIGVQESPILPVSTSVALGKSPVSELKSVSAELEQLTGLDGDFELQKDGTAPAKPWHPGPSSSVKISTNSQSPYQNIFPPGILGIHLPTSEGYNGFGQIMTNHWKAAATERLFACFDFRCGRQESTNEGSWRFYIGHNAQFPAVELGFNSSTLFQLNGDHRESVRSLKPGQWYQVQLTLNLKTKNYSASISTLEEHTEFVGQFATNWDGSIDYTFIDTGGHLTGVKPSVDVDNFCVGETALPSLTSPASPAIAISLQHKKKAAELRRQIEALTEDLKKVKKELTASLDEGPFDFAYGVSEGTPGNAHLQLRGEPDKPGEEVPRGFLKILGGGPLPAGLAGSGRLELAQWLTRPENPLTARVLVNRLWQFHFGTGLVKTPNDFGLRGQPATHPELLDHLATQLIQSGWSIKAMHRLIMGSAVYQQTSRSIDPPFSGLVKNTDPFRQTNTSKKEPNCFSPFARRRLSAEELRDAILFVSGELDSSPGQAHPFPAPTSWGFSQHAPFYGTYDHNKRSIYLMTQRIKRHPFLALFDGADPNASTAERRQTTVPTQALFFLNDPMVHEKAKKFAERLLAAGSDESQRIERAYRLAFGRSPTEVERTEAREFISEYRAELATTDGKDTAEIQAWAAYARVIFGSNEFLTID